MNEKQKKLLIAVIAVVIGMLICPPFHAILVDETRNLGYSLIFDPPKLGAGRTGTVDVGLLITQWLGVLIVGAAAFFLFKDD